MPVHSSAMPGTIIERASENESRGTIMETRVVHTDRSSDASQAFQTKGEVVTRVVKDEW